ncbi:unnamed protein product [Microthlaspi erraticum]|uniref:RNase H type-1 domain-containing protein n=1 Tax=Microthlaspi erraticum TaxID=1685480 RepID=A0A6D2I137_9BRAS|nr:unnamed protein product [Microthlaspi erraticum]
MAIPTSHMDRPDSMGWFFTKTGLYTVKSGYMFAQDNPMMMWVHDYEVGVWALSPIPTAITSFPTEVRNDKVFSNGDWDPHEIINHAAAEASAWALAQKRQDSMGPNLTATVDKISSGDRCEVDGSWKETDPRAGLGWYNFNMETSEKLLGTCNLWRGVSPLQTEVDALLWAMQCMMRHNKLAMVFEMDFSDVVKMVSKPEKWPAFAILLEEI